MGFARRAVRKSVRKATPRSVQRATHPVRTLKNAATPRSVRQVSRAVYTITNPLGAAENKFIGAALAGGSSRRSSGGPSLNYGAVGRVSGGGVRAAEAVASHDSLARLMAVQHERFAPAHPPIISDPDPVDPDPTRREEWARRKGEVRFWQRARRQQLRLEVDGYAQSSAAAAFAQALSEHRTQQARADAWWEALKSGESTVLTAALRAAFADNPVGVVVDRASGSRAILLLCLPGPDVLPQKKAHVTPGGRLSSKSWTKTEFNTVYANLIGAHLLATAREAWAVGPSMTSLRIVGVRRVHEIGTQILFDVEAASNEGDWTADNWGEVMLEHPRWGLKRTSRTGEVEPWPKEQLSPGLVY